MICKTGNVHFGDGERERREGETIRIWGDKFSVVGIGVGKDEFYKKKSCFTRKILVIF